MSHFALSKERPNSALLGPPPLGFAKCDSTLITSSLHYKQRFVQEGVRIFEYAVEAPETASLHLPVSSDDENISDPTY